MSLYEVAFEVIMEQTILVEAASGKAALEAVKRGEFDVMDCESSNSTKPRRNWTVQKIGDRNE